MLAWAQSHYGWRLKGEHEVDAVAAMRAFEMKDYKRAAKKRPKRRVKK